MATKTSAGVRIDVKSAYMAEESVPAMNQYVFVYEISITNLRHDTIQLMHRHWVITDGLGNVEEVKGPGVVGKQPRIKPGHTHTYNSFCPLPTPFGSMRGEYKFLLDSGEIFSAEIPLFSLVERAPISPENRKTEL
jgi:ApaG protein